LTPFVDQQWRRFVVAGFDPVGEEVSLVGLIPQILVEVGLRDLLEGFDVVDGDEVGVEVHELDADLLEGALGEEMSFDSREGLVGILIGLFNQTQFLSLRLIEAGFHRVGLLQTLERQDQ